MAEPNLLPCDGQVILVENWLEREEADGLMDQMVSGLDWQQEHARFGAKVVALPRLTAWYGDVGYRYSGVFHPPRPWPPLLAQLRERLSMTSGDHHTAMARPRSTPIPYWSTSIVPARTAWAGTATTSPSSARHQPSGR